jgi:hypothetical protein
MPCTACGVQVAIEDNYCRKCGVPLNVIDVPAVSSEARAMTVWEEAKPAVTRGVALIAAGALLRYAISWAGKAALAHALSTSQDSLDPRRIIPFGGSKGNGRRGSEEVEIVWYRRVRH